MTAVAREVLSTCLLEMGETDRREEKEERERERRERRRERGVERERERERERRERRREKEERKEERRERKREKEDRRERGARGEEREEREERESERRVTERDVQNEVSTERRVPSTTDGASEGRNKLLFQVSTVLRLTGKCGGCGMRVEYRPGLWLCQGTTSYRLMRRCSCLSPVTLHRNIPTPPDSLYSTETSSTANT